MDLSNIRLTLMELCSKMQRNCTNGSAAVCFIKKYVPPVINSWLRACTRCLKASCSIQPSNVVHDWRVLLDSKLSTSNHHWLCHQLMHVFHLRRIQIKRYLK